MKRKLYQSIDEGDERNTHAQIKFNSFETVRLLWHSILNTVKRNIKCSLSRRDIFLLISTNLYQMLYAKSSPRSLSCICDPTETQLRSVEALVAWTRQKAPSYSLQVWHVPTKLCPNADLLPCYGRPLSQALSNYRATRWPSTAHALICSCNSLHKRLHLPWLPLCIGARTPPGLALSRSSKVGSALAVRDKGVPSPCFFAHALTCFLNAISTMWQSARCGLSPLVW
jgi:hypothetical protein